MSYMFLGLTFFCPYTPNTRVFPIFLSTTIFTDCAEHFFFFCLLAISWAASTAYKGSQARRVIGAIAVGLCQSHSHAGYEPHLQPTPQLSETWVPQPTEQGKGWNLQPHGS